MRRDTDTDASRTTAQRVTVAEASRILDTSQDAIRKRVQRNTIEWEKDEEGRVYVWLDPSESRQAADQDASGTTIEVLQEQVDYLKEVVRQRDEEIRRRDHLLAAALERIPAIEPPPDTPSESRGSPESASEEEGRGEGRSEEERLSWWQRWFGAGT